MRSDKVVVSIDGHGADEALAGYHHYPRMMMQGSLLPWRLQEFREGRRAYEGMFEAETPEGVEFLSSASRKTLLGEMTRAPLRRMRRQAPGMVIRAMGGVDRIRSTRAGRLADRALESRREGRWDIGHPADLKLLKQEQPYRADAITKRLYRDFHFDILPTILAKFDRMSMAHGVEIRSPFLDWRLVSFTFSLPSSSVIRSGYTKAILREAIRGTVPESIRLRRSKIGFASPMITWYETGLRDLVLDTANSQSFRTSSVWNGPVISEALNRWMSTGNYGEAVRTWPYIQAQLLTNSFAEAAARHAQGG